uniref:Uncharacterized protein n=1 Tax=Arundo donax TaxID=35708 RepID=A0A0A9FQY1_ARUDO
MKVPICLHVPPLQHKNQIKCLDSVPISLLHSMQEAKRQT